MVATAVAGLSLLLAACPEKKLPEPPRDAPREPIQVTTAISDCKDVADCERECEAKKPGACMFAGRYYEYGRGVTANPVRAFSLYERSCSMGFAGGCYNAALLLETGRGVEKDVKRARELFDKVCRMGSQTACARLTDI